MDNKLKYQSLASDISEYQAEVLAVYNYYPFGMLQPNMYAENNYRRTRFGSGGMLRYVNTHK